MIVDGIASDLKSYLMAKRSLLHPSTGFELHAARPVAVEELAVLAQNKLYEHTASEAEELLFIRGGQPRNLDPLDSLTTAEKIKKAALSGLFYYEIRNFLRHRAQRAAYLLVAEEILGGPAGSANMLAADILKHLRYKQSHDDIGENLFQILQIHVHNESTMHLCC